MSRTARPIGVAALAMTALIALAGCSSSGDTGKTSGSSGGTVSSSATGTGDSGAASPSKATGSPILIGMINQENTPAGSFPEMRQALQASFSYINDELGGVNGRPLKLQACASDASPASSANCARKLLDEKPIAVAAGADFGAAGSLPVLEKAKVPYVGGEPLLPPELSNANSWAFVGGSVGAFPAQAYYIAKVLKAKKVGILTTANPAGMAAATTYGKDVLTTLGVKDVQIVSAAADAADFSAPLHQITAGNPDVVMVLFSAQGCSRIMQARASLGVPTKFFFAGSCADADVLKAGGAGAEGAYFNSELQGYTADDPQVQIYRDKMKKYQPSAAISGFSQNGFETGMNLYALLKPLSDSEISPAGLSKALAATQDQPNFMGHAYTCDRKQVSGAPAVCQAFERIMQYSGGKFVDQGQWVNGAQYLGK